MARHFIFNVVLRRGGALGAKTGQEKQNHPQAKTKPYLSEFTHGPTPFLDMPQPLLPFGDESERHNVSQ
jgi:hypothetical protein